MYHRCTFILVSLLGSFLLAQVAVAEDTSSPFDGKSLDAWSTLDGKPVTQGWEAADGVIHLKKEGRRTGHIVTRQEFGDFRLAFEFKIAERGNSGIKYRVRRYGNKVLGCEYQIYDDLGHKTPATSVHGTAALYDLYSPSASKVVKPAGEWNEAVIVVQRDRIEHWLNGKLVVSANVGDDEWQRRVGSSKFNDAKDFSRNRTGQFMLTDHGSEVWYRNFVFEPLDK